jgi:hypothetical protein
LNRRRSALAALGSFSDAKRDCDSADRRCAGARREDHTADRNPDNSLQRAHWAISLLKRWLFGTHGSAVSAKHLQAYLDEYVFRYNRRKTKGVGRIAARTIERLVATPPLTMRRLVDETRMFRAFPELGG